MTPPIDPDAIIYSQVMQVGVTSEGRRRQFGDVVITEVSATENIFLI